MEPRTERKKYTHSVSDETFDKACYALWLVEKEYTSAEAARLLDLQPAFVDSVRCGGTCKEAAAKTPPDEIVEAALKL